jgi:hypothetical protein
MNCKMKRLLNKKKDRFKNCILCATDTKFIPFGFAFVTKRWVKAKLKYCYKINRPYYVQLKAYHLTRGLRGTSNASSSSFRNWRGSKNLKTTKNGWDTFHVDYWHRFNNGFWLFILQKAPFSSRTMRLRCESTPKSTKVRSTCPKGTSLRY